MNRMIKIIGILITLFVTISLIGCSLSDSSESLNGSQNGLEKKEQIKINSVVANKVEEDEKPGKQTEQKEQLTVVRDSSISTTSKDITLEKNQPLSTPKTEPSATTMESKELDESKTTSVNEETKITTNISSTKKDNNDTELSTDAQQKTQPTPTVSILINGPKDIGVLLPNTKVKVSEGDTVLDVLLKLAKTKNFFVEYSGSGAMTYIEGIDNIYEFDYGPKSGWNFKLNGTTINKSSGIVEVKKDDKIEWVYSEDFTEEGE